MENEITEASKILATYMGYKYYGFNCPESLANPKMKLGWYKIRDKKLLHPALLHSSKLSHVFIDENTVGSYVCRLHGELRYWNSYDWLFEVIDKLEKEDLSRYMYSWTDDEDETKLQYNFNGVDVWVDSERVCVRINQQLDPGIKISGEEDKELPKKQRLFWALVESVKYINELKNRDND